MAPLVTAVLDVDDVVTKTNGAIILDPFVLGANNLITNASHLALVGVLPGYPTGRSEELLHAYLLYWPDDHKVFKEIFDKEYSGAVATTDEDGRAATMASTQASGGRGRVRADTMVDLHLLSRWQKQPWPPSLIHIEQ